jgi:alpha-L-fucosidase
MFSDAGPDVRWIGNENGHAGPTNWSMMDKSQVRIGGADVNYLNAGDPAGTDWIPGECDVSIRKGWFYHPDQAPKTVEELLDIYFKSVGRNGVLLLNVPPNRMGLFDNRDVTTLIAFRQRLDAIFSRNLAQGGSATATRTRGNDPTFAAQNVLDENNATFWTTDDSLSTGELQINLPASRTFNIIALREPVAYGQRISSYRIESWQNGSWAALSQGTTIGNKKLERVAKTTAMKIRIIIEKSKACPLLSEVGLYYDPGK